MYNNKENYFCSFMYDFTENTKHKTKKNCSILKQPFKDIES